MNRIVAIVGLAATLAAPASGLEWAGFVAFEARAFFTGSGAEGQSSESFSLVFQPELYHEWDDGDQSLRFTPFARLDSQDDERSHLDLRELYWHRAARDWELAVGWRRVFWGVTESEHLVDIINQTDLVEDLDTEQKLGQPMVQLSLIRSWGTFDFFVLPGFRERTFAGSDGRLRTRPRVAADEAVYESSKGSDHADWAVRWSHSLGAVDVGLAHFSGTGREPRLLPGVDAAGETVLIPHYDQIDQSSLDLQVTLGAWLWKLEGIYRDSQALSFGRAIGGFEYTFFDIRRSGIDLGLLAEYVVDDRDESSQPLFLGSRLTLNDVQGTDLLVGAIIDRDQGSLLNVEASRRLGNRWRASLRVRAFVDVPDSGAFFALRDDDYVEVEIARYF